MDVSFSSKGDFRKTEEWLRSMSKAFPKRSLESIAQDGVDSLKQHTPRDTGETAEGWYSEIKMDSKGVEISWLNRAHPESSANIAKLIENGHGTGTGGYVPPRPFIKQAMEGVWKTTGGIIDEELTKK